MAFSFCYVRTHLARLILNNSLLLLVGTVAAVLWANVDLPRYTAFMLSRVASGNRRSCGAEPPDDSGVQSKGNFQGR